MSSAHLPLYLRDPGRSLQPPAPAAHTPGTSAERRCPRGEAGARHLEPSELLFAMGNSVARRKHRGPSLRWACSRQRWLALKCAELPGMGDGVCPELALALA